MIIKLNNSIFPNAKFKMNAINIYLIIYFTVAVTTS